MCEKRYGSRTILTNVIEKALHSSTLSEDLYFEEIVMIGNRQFNYITLSELIICLSNVNFDQSESLRERSKCTIQSHHVKKTTTRWWLYVLLLLSQKKKNVAT